MTSDESANLLRRAAERARTRPEFLGWVLARYEEQAAQGEDMRKLLRVSDADWIRLQLCLRPRPDHFLPDVTQIAQAFDIDRAALAAVVRRVEALQGVRERRQPGSAGSLLAARTRKPTEPPAQHEEPGDERP